MVTSLRVCLVYTCLSCEEEITFACCLSARLWRWRIVIIMPEIWETKYTDNNATPSLSSLFVVQRPSIIRTETWGSFGDNRGGRGKGAWWRKKAAISPKRVKIGEKLLWMAYRNSQTLFHSRPPRPYRYRKGCLFHIWSVSSCICVSMAAKTILIWEKFCTS